jgi:hypothetical protein
MMGMYPHFSLDACHNNGEACNRAALERECPFTAASIQTDDTFSELQGKPEIELIVVVLELAVA